MPQELNPFEKVPPADESTLNCQIGNFLIAKETTSTEEGIPIKAGAVYRVIGRIYYGWDLELVRGGGAPDVRILNSRILDYFSKAADDIKLSGNNVI